ncbi:MAG: LLM class F420-dependent oxidoreductase, partial [Dermatophilaceae bacterium]
VNVFIGRNDGEVADRLEQYVARRAGAGLREDRVRAEVEGLRGAGGVGTPEKVVEDLRAFGDVGLGYAITYFPEAAYDYSGIELFAREVIPELAG